MIENHDDIHKIAADLAGILKDDPAFMTRVSSRGSRSYKGFVQLVMINPVGYVEMDGVNALFSKLFTDLAGSIEQDDEDGKRVDDWNAFLDGMRWDHREIFDSVLDDFKELFSRMTAEERDAMLDLLFMYSEMTRVLHERGISVQVDPEIMRDVMFMALHDVDTGVDPEKASMLITGLYDKISDFSIYIEEWLLL